MHVAQEGSQEEDRGQRLGPSHDAGHLEIHPKSCSQSHFAFCTPETLARQIMLLLLLLQELQVQGGVGRHKK